MAALGRPFSGLPLSGGSDFLQPPQPAFPGRAFPPGADGAELAPRPGPRAVSSSPAGSAARGRVSVHCKKKHKREEEDDDCPVRKKRITEAELCAGPNDWILCAHQDVEGHGVNPSISGLSVPGILDVICEEMDQTTGEPQCEVARRKLQEIEDRIIDEDEEVEADRNVNHLPSLVLSDTMKTGLKREFDEVFTKKMIESMQPCFFHPVWSAALRSWLTATFALWPQAILPPQLPQWLGPPVHTTMPGYFFFTFRGETVLPCCPGWS
ncbi:coiled-coil domain-containing protein 117 isoform X2 [Hylobates moloch]|uniref:coiled-coil domain-containing protein 117 isoform X2 n=1 Tax=Hylobates moloch TaxID=81572 RepID=UPI002674E6D8|nr:coiled-coil domain-containing protein 117 isoform X2 [Hylobates moloch]